MKAAPALLYIQYAATIYAASDSGRPRGVSPDFAKFYKDTKTFTCISNPSINIPFVQVNDDYCDCPDGSDEPGSSACAHLSPYSPPTTATTSNTTLALPGFYCKNIGHQPAYVPFTNVNDGVCDYDSCCDGSEEWEGFVKCENRCKELGAAFSKAVAGRQKSLTNAGRKRKELVAEAARLRRQVEDRVKTLGTEIEGAEVHVRQLETELAEVEKREKGKVVKSKEGAKGGKVGVLVGLARQRMDELRENLVRVKGERDDSRGRLEELETILSTFKEEYNPNFNDEGVKRAVRAWEDYAARDDDEPETARDRDLQEITKSDKENGLDWDEYGGDEEETTETDVLYSFENYLPPTLRTWLDQKLRSMRRTLIESGILADTSSSTSSTTESKAVSDARTGLSTAEKEVSTFQKDLTSHKEDLEKDFGPDDIFRALKGTCVSTDSGEYTYEVCFLDRTNQKPKKGGGSTNMGSFTRLERVYVDEGDVPADGRGLGTGERIAMKYENGQHCWNGPNRQSTVVLGCAEVNEVWRIMEEEKCVYRLEVGTPAVCEGNGSKKGEEGKDEL